MGTISHEALIVEGGEEERAVVLEIAAAYKAELEDLKPWDIDFSQLVSPVMKAMTNGYEFFFIAPDGSKEWWDTSDHGNEFRIRVVDALQGRRTRVVAVCWGELGDSIVVDPVPRRDHV